MENLSHIEEYIPYGRNNAVKRADLVSMIGASDRLVRRMIEDARQSGIVIINMQDGRGYYRPEKREDLEYYIRQEEGRVKSIHRNLKAAKKALRAIEGQLTLDEM